MRNKMTIAPDVLPGISEHADLGLLEFHDTICVTRYGRGDRYMVGTGRGCVVLFIGAANQPIGIYAAISPEVARELSGALLRAAAEIEAASPAPAGTVLQ